MKIAITGGAGFVGSRLARKLHADGHEIVLITRRQPRADSPLLKLPGVAIAATGLDRVEALTEALRGCHTLAHCAGINRELGEQTYRRVHIDGTRNLVEAARRAGVRKIVLLSFLKARPNCGSPYHESKWAAEELVRNSGLDFSLLKCGVIYGRGDHMLDHLSHAFHTFPVFGLVGFHETNVRPTAVGDVIKVLEESLCNGRLTREAVAVLGPEEMPLSEAVRRVAAVTGKSPLFIRMPVFFHFAMAWVLERTMVVPLVATAQVRILSEGVSDPLPGCRELPRDLRPVEPFSASNIQAGLPPPARFGLKDCLCLAGMRRPL